MSTSGPPEAVWEPDEREPLPPGVPLPTSGVPLPAHGPPPPIDPSPRPGSPPRAPHKWGFGAYLLAEAVFLLSAVLLALPFAGDRDAPPSPLSLLLGLSVPTILAATVALIATRWRGNGPRIDLGLRWDWRDVGLGMSIGFAGLLLTIPAAIIWASLVGQDEASSAVGEVFAGRQFSAGFAVAIFLVVWLVAPICEEIVYRGLLWGAMERHGASRWLAFALTTLVFALAHFEFTRTPLLLVISVPIGIARLITGRLTASIIAHQVNNLLPAMALLLMLLGVLQV